MTSKLRRTKIVTTLGPSTDKDNVLEEIIKAGANVVRMNFSHGTSEDHIQRAKSTRDCRKIRASGCHSWRFTGT